MKGDKERPRGDRVTVPSSRGAAQNKTPNKENEIGLQS